MNTTDDVYLDRNKTKRSNSIDTNRDISELINSRPSKAHIKIFSKRFPVDFFRQAPFKLRSDSLGKLQREHDLDFR
jgi:hypothetical protein